MNLVSVIIPCYRQAHFLSEAIDSVLSQTYREFEIIVVDDGSPDNVSEVVSHYRNIRYIRQENQGRSSARNAGLAESKGKFLVFLDSDDRFLPEALRTGVNCLETHPEFAFIYGKIKIIRSDGSYLCTPDQPCIKEDHYIELLNYNFIWTSGIVMFRRSVFDSVIGYDRSLVVGEDWDLYLRVARTFPIFDHGKVIIEHRLHEGKITGDPSLMLKSTLAAFRLQLDHVTGIKIYEEAYKSGVKNIKEYYGEPLIDKVRRSFKMRCWASALRDLIVLAEYYPRGLLKLISGKRALKQTLNGELI